MDSLKIVIVPESEFADVFSRAIMDMEISSPASPDAGEISNVKGKSEVILQLSFEVRVKFSALPNLSNSIRLGETNRLQLP